MSRDIEIVSIRSEAVEVRVAPELGAKIVSLRDLRTSREWLAQAARLFRNAPGDPFENSMLAGVDECLPTVAACEWSGRALPDHGEVWNIPWTLDRDALASGVIRTHVELPVSPFWFERAIRMEESRVILDYRLTNLSTRDEAFLWAIHPLLRFEANLELDLPVEEVRVESASCASPDDRWPWPREVPEGHYAKLFASDLREGRAAIRCSRTDESLGFHFDPKQNGALGIWISRGGWNGQHQIALEPTNSAADSLAQAVTEKRGYGTVPASGACVWSLRLNLERPSSRS